MASLDTVPLSKTQWAVQADAVGDRPLPWVPQCERIPDSHQVSTARVG
ncbi:MAG: hypothetical protein AAFY26_09110 [Cyanobacteria bacterium J06638_22]